MKLSVTLAVQCGAGSGSTVQYRTVAVQRSAVEVPMQCVGRTKGSSSARQWQCRENAVQRQHSTNFSGTAVIFGGLATLCDKRTSRPSCYEVWQVQ